MSKNILETDKNEFYKQMFKDFNKTKEDLSECIDIMEKWADTQPHFPEKPTYRTLRFLILYNKFSIERAKQKLDMYYTVRTLMPEIYKWHPLSPELVQHSKVMYIVPLPKVTHDLKRIYYMQINPKYDPDDFSHEKMEAQFLNLLELFIEADDCYNFHCILDCAGLKIGHLTKFNPMLIKKTSFLLEKVFSNRISSIHLVNFAPFVENFLNNVAKPLLNSKIRNRIKIYKGTNILLEVFGKSFMPRDIGGEESSLEELNDLLLQKYKEHKERFDKLPELKTDESLRPEKLINDDILGYYGSFRKINID